MRQPKPRNRLARIAPLTLALAGLSAGLVSRAGSATYDFNAAPPADLQFVGNAEWRASGGVNDSGYMSLFDAINSQHSSVLIPDFDNGLIVKAFTFEVDLRVGNAIGNGGRPADGFSISYARASDPVVADLKQEPPVDDTGKFAVAGGPENGTSTGVAISFDTWSGNVLPDGADLEGLIVRVDNVTKAKIAMPTRNGSCTDATSLQTGPWDGLDTGDPSGLCWAPLKVVLAENGELTVTWKNVNIVTNLQTGFLPSAGRIVFAGRTGGANENTHIDNLKITTIAAETALVSGVTGMANGFTFTIDDAGTSVLKADTLQVKLDGATVTPTSVTKGAITTTVKYTSPTLLAAGSTHTLDISFQDTLGRTVNKSAPFEVPAYVIVADEFAMPDGTVDKTKPGFLIRPYETEASNPNSLAWTEDQLAGLYGPNLADLSGADANGFYVHDTFIDFDIATGNGNFQNNLPFPGLPGSGTLDGGTGNAAMEMLTYLEFTAPGMYTMGVNSDDGFRVSVAKNPRGILGVRCGQFDGGRGAADTLFNIYIEKAGLYPFRLLWQNGGGGANCEWFTVVDGVKILVNDVSNTKATKAYRSASIAYPYVARIAPKVNETGIRPDTDLLIELVDGTTQVVQNSIAVELNGKATTPTVTKSGSKTTVNVASTGLLPSGSTNIVALKYKDNGTNQLDVSTAYAFYVANYRTLPTDLVSPIGSEDKTKPGFNVRTVQLAARSNTMPNNNEWAEGVLARVGLLGDNDADLSLFTGGIYAETATINYSHTEGENNGNFTPDRQHPGIPGLTGIRDNYTSDFVTYIPFAQPGTHVMGVNSDDNFRVTIGEQPGRQYLQVLAPASIAGGRAAVATSSPMNVNPGFGGPLPTTPIVADAVVLGTSCLADPALPDLTGKIAVIIRGGCTFVEKCRNAQSKGALAVVICNSAANEGAFPIVMGGDGLDITIPVMMVDYKDGQTLINNPTGLRLSIGKDTNFQVGEFNANGRGASDTTFAFYVPQAGVYPFRCFYLQGGGGANVEWFTVNKDGSKVLLNDTTATALKTYRARTFTPRPTISVARAGANLTITYTGTLQAADEVTGPWADVAGATSPRQVALDAAAKKFWRAKQ